LHEQNRKATANRYLKRIKYGNQTPYYPDDAAPQPVSLPTDWFFQIVFDYGDHDAGIPGIDDDQRLKWLSRPDPFSTYRAGFEIRTYRICRRVLIFHHFVNELRVEPYLVRSTDFLYSQDKEPGNPQNPIYSFLISATQTGYVKKTSGSGYDNKSLPPLEFAYTQVKIGENLHLVDSASLENLPYGLDGTRYQWVDLDSEGLPGILTEQAAAWFYKRNMSNLPTDGNGAAARFEPVELVVTKPSLADLQGGQQQLMDLAGDGQLDLVQFRGPLSGFYERDPDGEWLPFTPFAFSPNIDWNNPNLKTIDLDGDGHADILITEDEVFTWYPSRAEEGFGPAETVRKLFDEEKGPALVFADNLQSIYLADMSGDGLTDIVRICNGKVCYWPNLGYGHFGAKIVMDHAPFFDHPDLFEQKCIRLADVDGSGTTDIIYLGRGKVTIWFNQSGNSWSKPQELSQFPAADNLESLTVVDLLGNGTACLVWSSPLPGDLRRQMRYIDLMGGQKPHLLISMKNNLGAETKVQYTASTRFYLQDRFKGTPWITRLPFPVHVVERVETYDWISRNCFVSRYAYHHGYFDGIEREFRGFGMVEQWDTEEFATLNDSDSFPVATNIEEASHVPPVWTKTWFHTGAYFEESRISRQFENEYFRESDLSEGVPGLTDTELHAMLLDDTVLPAGLSPEETREACRSLKGPILRQEIYARDRSEEEDRPYSVSERNYTIKLLQPRGENKYAVFFTHPRETIDFHYERKLFDVGGNQLADPRVSHVMTLVVDDFGNVERSVTIGYPRRAIPERQPEQAETHITLTVNRFVNYEDQQGWYRVGLPIETQTYEIVRPPEPTITASLVALFKFEAIRTLAEDLFKLNQDEPDAAKTLPYEKWNWRKDASTPPESRLRLIERVRTLYYKDDLSTPLLLGRADSLGLPYETYKLAFTPALLTYIYKRDTEDLLPDSITALRDEGGYVLSDDYKARGWFPNSDANSHWWIPSGQQLYSPIPRNPPPLRPPDPILQDLVFARRHFYLPQGFRDPFGSIDS
jgi:hypothetical protein